MSALDALLGKVYFNGVEVELGGGLNFAGGFASVAYNPATNTIDIVSSGGGGGGHTIKDEASTLTQRTVLKFTGPNVSASDFGGETVVLVPAIDLTSGTATSGQLPWTSIASAMGGKILTGLKSITYTVEVPSTGPTPSVDWTLGDLHKTTLSANATPTFTPPAAGVGWVQWHVVQDSTPRTITFPGSVVGTPPQPATANGSHTFYQFFWDGTSYHFTGAAVTLSGTTLSLTGSALKLRDAAASGQQWIWLGGAWYLIGPETAAALTDANATLQFATSANLYFWPAATNTTNARALTLGTTGLAAAPMAGVGAEIEILFLRAGYAHNITVVNGGGAGGTIFTLPTSTTTPIAAEFYYDGTNWFLAGWRYLTTVTAA